MQAFNPEIRTVEVTRYVTPLREGGSLPAVTEADDGFMYVLKFRGAGQGVKALIAELISGLLAKLMGLKLPEIVFAHLDEAFGRTEPDEEIQDLLKASRGLNLAMHYLQGAFIFDAVVNTIDADTASKIVWLDSLITNVDRTARNTNMLIWHDELWLIDHGASLYFQHALTDANEQAKKPFTAIRDHVLLPYATQLDKVNETFSSLITKEDIETIINIIPDNWLDEIFPDISSSQAKRQVYKDFLITRLSHSDSFTQEAKNARETLI
ncbi:MAG: aminotransferase class I and II [Bacteroidetes bacterium]|nr:aminotransferase class I and II [Bacteroidota bacterium]